MRVLLINPFQVDLVHKRGRIYNRRWTPLDLANTAAVLEREGIETAIVDANAEQLGPQQVAGRARGFDKVFITSTSLDRWQCPHLDINPFLKTVRAVQQVAPEVYVMGSHGTVKPVEMLEETRARAIIRGEPEVTVRELCRTSSLAEVPGITYQNGGQAVSNPDPKPLKMDEFPLPAFHLLPMGLYHYEVLGKNFCLFEMSRGCASDCTFCLLKPYGVGVRKKSVDRLIADVEHGIKQFGVRTAYFIDLEFTVLRKQVVEFCKYLSKKSYDFTWCCQTRFDLVDEELLALMKQAGCRLIHFGVEAGSEEVLKTVDKDITMKEIEAGMKKVKAAGLESACFFIMGFPGAQPKDMDDIRRFANRLNPTYALFHVAAPYPGTQMYDEAKNDPNVRFSDGTLFPEAYEGPLSVQQLKSMTRNAYLRYYTRPSYLFSRVAKGEFRALANQVNLFWQFVRA